VSALVFAADENYARALAVAMHSALEHLSPRVSPAIYVLDDGIARASRERLLRVAEHHGAGSAVEWIQVPRARLSHLDSALAAAASVANSALHMTSTTWARLLVPELLPAHVRRAVYLDDDLIVRRDLSPLFELDLGDALLAAVSDFAVASLPHPLWGEAARPYFNSGVLVMDVERWRRAGFGDQVLARAAEQNGAFPFADQDAMNAVTDNWYELGPEWNVQQGFLWRPALVAPLARQRDAIYDKAAVLHFTGASKPWHSDSTSPGTSLWARELMRSGWYTRIESLAWLASWLSRRLLHMTGRRAAALGRRVSQRR
jgi:lipopolysaccharide biosynthesis glycosyltransferase